ncbi:Agglutinin-2 [Senna tora]|uniref:Agglutinin-2 n=1 Tax=Senna tora TaxID=362788 RepID=A0A834STY8_9FABA|nr:Agglutinin-2 [Senna tora]
MGPNVVMSLMMIPFLMVGHNVHSASFQFDNLQFYTKDISLQGDAFISNGTIQLSQVALNSAGRASYAAPIHLWDAETGDLAWFTTTFSFIVGPAATTTFGDGISFFLSPFPSILPTNSAGGFLGLFSAETALNAYENQIVAVEYDTYGNPWDPPSAHIGININSIASATSETLPSVNVGSGLTAFATVNYEPNAKNLSVVVTYPQFNVNVESSVSVSLWFLVDLRTVLPEWVSVGFSGATGQRSRSLSGFPTICSTRNLGRLRVEIAGNPLD